MFSQLFDILYTAYWQQIHIVLVPQENKTAEAELRSHIRCSISNHLLPLYAKVEKLSKIAKKSPENTKLLNKEEIKAKMMELIYIQEGSRRCPPLCIQV